MSPARDAAALEAAVDSEDYSALGPLLTTAVDPPDNGWVAFLSVIRLCIDAGIDFVVVDNTRMRRTPEATMRTLCDRLGITYDESMTAWQTLDSALDRVVMGEMALDREYPWYYAGTLSSDHGIVPESRQPLAVDRFPAELRGTGGDHVSIDEAMIWYQLLLASDHCLP